MPKSKTNLEHHVRDGCFFAIGFAFVLVILTLPGPHPILLDIGLLCLGWYLFVNAIKRLIPGFFSYDEYAHHKALKANEEYLRKLKQ